MKRCLLSMLLAFVAMTRPARAEAPFACDLHALSQAERTHHQELTRGLMGAVVEREELPNGYGFRLDPARVSLIKAAEWITLEGRCCPFFDFQLMQARQHGSTWLRLTGREGVKAFIRAEFQL